MAKTKLQSKNRLIRNLVSSLIIEEKVITTEKRAKLLKADMEKILSKVPSMKELDRLRYLKSHLYGGAVQKLIDHPKMFTSVSVIKVKRREGDNALLSAVILRKSENKKETKNKDVKKNEGKK